MRFNYYLDYLLHLMRLYSFLFLNWNFYVTNVTSFYLFIQFDLYFVLLLNSKQTAVKDSFILWKERPFVYFNLSSFLCDFESHYDRKSFSKIILLRTNWQALLFLFKLQQLIYLFALRAMCSKSHILCCRPLGHRFSIFI